MMGTSDDLVLSDLLNSVLDRGVVITGSVLISVADVDLVRLEVSLMLTAVETELARERRRALRDGALPGPPPAGPHGAGRAPGSPSGAPPGAAPRRSAP